MTPFSPLKTLLDTLHTLGKATTEEIIAHTKLVTPEDKTKIRKALGNAHFNDLVCPEKNEGEKQNYWMLTALGRERQKGKELTLSKKAATITSADVDKTIAKFTDIKPSYKPPVITQTPRAPRKDFGATFNTDGKLIIWNGQDEVIFNPTDAAKVIAFIANQMPWVEYCKQHGSTA